MKSEAEVLTAFQINCRGKLLDLSSGPKIMGILNTTPDSFFDGGSFNKESGCVDLERALDHALAMVKSGASIVDIGGESSRPGAEKISAGEEIRRTIPLIKLLQRKTDVLISIDTYKSNVAAEALRAGAHMVNDISGFTFDTDLPGVCNRYRAAVILMHTPVKPENMQWSTAAGSEDEDILARVSRFLEHSIGVAERNSIHDIIIDPGFGFGKSVEENFRLLNGLSSLATLKRPILAGLSRKSFLGHAITPEGEEMLPPSKRLPATITAETIALLNGASILRVHDVEAAAQSLRVVKALKRF